MTRILALTGSIGMGKSTVAAQLKQLGARVVDADAIVHQLLSPKGKAFEAVAAELIATSGNKSEQIINSD